MAIDLQEQEQLASLKAWWERHGTKLLIAISAVLAVVVAINGFDFYRQRQSEKAAVVYDDVIKAVAARDVAKLKELSASIATQYGNTVYASLAAIQLAKVAYEANDAATAKAQLQWVIEKSGHKELSSIARVRLAGVLLDEKQLDEALKLLAVDAPDTQKTYVADRRGDILVAQGKLQEARTAFQQALDAADPQNPLRGLIQLKLDALPATAAR